MVPCNGFELCGFIAEIRGGDPQPFWPFPGESPSLVDQQSDSLPPSSVVMFELWGRVCSTRNINVDGTNDSGLPSNSRSITSTNGLNGSSSIIPRQSILNSPTATDQEIERNTDIAGNDVVVNEDVNCQISQNDDQRDNAVVNNENVNCERSQNDDQRDNAVVENEDVNSQRSQQDDQRGNAVVENNEDVNCERSQQDDQRVNTVVENENVNCEIPQKDNQTGNALVVNEDANSERPQKDDQRVTRSSKKVPPPILKTYGHRNKSNKKAVVEPVGKKPNVENVAVTETPACVEDTEPEESESRQCLFIGGAPSMRARRSRTRKLTDLTDKPKTRREENIARNQSLRGKKRKSPSGNKKVSTAGAASGSASKSVDESNHGGTEPTESAVDTDPNKGKKKNVMFKEDDFELDSEPEVEEEDDPDFYPSRARRTKKKVKIAKKKRATARGRSNEASSSVQPSLNENETVPSSPREERAEERVGTSLDDQLLASEGYIRKPNAPPVNDRQESSRMRSSYVPVFGNPSIPNTGRGLGTGPNAMYFGSSSNNNSQRSTAPSTQVAVPQKEASTPNTGRGLGTGPPAIYLGSSSNNNNQRSTPSSSTQVAVPQKDASIPNTGRGLGTRSGAIYGSSNNNNQRSTRPSTQVAVPQKDASKPNTGRGMGTGRDAIYFGSSSSNNNNNLRSTTPSTQVAVPQKDASIPNTSIGLGTRSGAIYGSSNNNNQRSTRPSTQVAVPQKDASIPNTGRGLGTGRDAIYFGSSSNNNNQRSMPPSTQVAVPQKGASIPNTGRGLGTGPGATLFGARSNSNNNNQRSTPPSTQVAVPQKDASILNTGRGLGTGPGAFFGGRSNNNNNSQRSTPSSRQVAVPQKDASIPNTGRGLGTGPSAIYFGSSNNNNNNQRSTPPSTQVAVPQKDASIPNTGRGLGTGRGSIYEPIYLGSSSSSSSNNLRSTPPSTVVAAQPSVPQKDASVSDRKGKRVMVQSHDETENNLPQEVPQKPKTPFPFDLNEVYEEGTSLEDTTNAATEEDRVSVRSEQNSVEMFPPRQNMSSPPVRPPPVQESRRSSIPFPGHNNPQWLRNVPMATPYHHPSPSTYQVRRVPHHFRAPSPPVWASSMRPPQYHHLTPPPAPFNMDYSSMYAQAPSNDTWNLSYIGANLMNQAMMDPRFRSNAPVDHHGNIFFTPTRHVHPVNQFNYQPVELQRSHERPVFPRTMSNQGRFQQRRNAASSSNASTSYAENSYESSTCVISRYPGEISDIEPYMVAEEDLHVLERMAEFEKAEDQIGPFTESG